MAEIQRTQTFSFPIKRCFKSLLRVLPVMEIQVMKSDPENYIAEGHWSPGGSAKITLRAECIESGAELTQVTFRHDMQWTPMLSRPNVINEKAAKGFDERVLVKMDTIFETLGNYLEDETSLPKMPAGLELDYPSWIFGAVVSIGLRLLAGIAGPAWLPGMASGTTSQTTYLRIMGVVGVLVGAAAAGLLKRRNPQKGNAFFEGIIVALANVWLSFLIYTSFFSMGCVDWGIYGLTGLTVAALASIQFSRKNQ